MAAYRVTMIFNFLSEPVCGFSERYDIDAANDAAAQAVAGRLRDARRDFLSEDWKIVAVRLGTLVPVLHESKCRTRQRVIILCPDIGGAIGRLGAADTPTSAVFADFFYTSVRKPSHRQFRGIPDDWWVGTALTQAKEAIGTFCSSLKRNGHVRYVNDVDCTTLQPFALKCCNTRRISERRVGRPFGLLRGRRSKRKILPTSP